ncbi:hypothetical protein TRFO_06916 [Tritrichomonas foetus]|uniref:Uncharacterized protein n=1 Tax=Tritrichomonas foetus TaxID=1144522 RepID=A0A1J4JWP0_9EUKA|nr:hypothetical protein TRFO_06916 [Tritrichomonas foetus]|eukprot:OHT02872.1 hypothetical protein TRFO_06916 [Tritrichomonas foetus]
MDDESISQYLIDKQYFLTALELLSETYERTGVPIETLSNFFQDSANFLNFDPMHGVHDVSPDSQQNNSTEALRIKDDRISVLEHDVKVLKDSLKEAEEKIKEAKPKVEVKSPSKSLTGNIDTSEEIVIKNLILKFLQSRGFRITALSFQNEAGKTKQSSEIEVPDDVELVHLLRSFLYLQNTSKINIEIENLKKEKIEARNKISQLTVDLDVSKKTIQELEAQIKQLKEINENINNQNSQLDENQENADDSHNDSSIQNSDVKVSNNDQSVSGNQQNYIQVEINHDPPSVQLLDSVFSDIEPLIKVVDSSKKTYLINPLKTIVKNHPSREVRSQCIQLIFNMWDNPNTEQREIIVNALKDCASDTDKAESEIIPYVTQMMASSNVNVLCLVVKTVGEFSALMSMQLRYTLLLSIIRQFAEHSAPAVRRAAAEDGATLVLSLGDNEDATEKLDDLVALGKHFVFDSDADVQSAGLCAFIPAVLRFAQLRKCVGKSMFDYWLKLALSFGLTGQSQLAVLRFKLCTQVLETTTLFLLPSEPTNKQTIVCEGGTVMPDHVVVSKPDFEWITTVLPQSLPKFSPILFVPIPIKKEAAKFVTKCCKAVGQKFTEENIAPVFLKLIEESPPEPKMQNMAMFIAAVSPQCNSDTFYENAKKYLTYAANETHDFRQTDIETFFSPAFALLSSLEPTMRKYIFKLCGELVSSLRSGIRSAAMNVINEVLQTADQKEIENDIFPIVIRLAHDPDESLQFETINCIGNIARFSTISTVIDSIKELFDDWFKQKPNIKLQALRSIVAVVNDVDSQFRDQYIIPKIVDITKPEVDWGHIFDQAVIIIIQSLRSMDDISEQVIREYIIPLVQTLSETQAAQNDPMFAELKERYGLVPSEKSGFSFLKK